MSEKLCGGEIWKLWAVQTFLCAHINWMYVSTLQIIDLFAIFESINKRELLLLLLYCYSVGLCKVAIAWKKKPRKWSSLLAIIILKWCNWNDWKESLNIDMTHVARLTLIFYSHINVYGFLIWVNLRHFAIKKN